MSMEDFSRFSVPGEPPRRVADPADVPTVAEFAEAVAPADPAPMRRREDDRPVPPPAPPVAETEPPEESEADDTDSNSDQPIGVMLDVAGSGSQIALDIERLNECMADADPSIALAGQVGSQIKIRVGTGWLLGSVRNQRQDRRKGGGIIADIDFLGEAVRRS